MKDKMISTDRGVRLSSAVTIIELLIVVVLIVSVITVIALVLKGGFDAWSLGEGGVALQRQAQKIMREIVEGKDDIPGIREALEIVQASPASLGVVPLWIDIYRKYDGEKKEFVLSKQFKPGGAIPVGQIRAPGSKKFISVPIVFTYGESRNPDSLDDVVYFTDAIPKGADVRILFYPDASADEKVIMRYYWDKGSQRVFRRYNGHTEDIMRYDKKVKVTDFKFTYFDNLNNQIMPVYGAKTQGKTVPERMSAFSALGIAFSVKRDSLAREVSSFVGIRGLGGNLGSGLALSEGTAVKIPNSKRIRTLVIDNIEGVKHGEELKLEIKSAANSKTWSIAIEFGIVDGLASIIGFDVEYPLGSNVYSSRRRRLAKKGLNLLKLGNEYFDYDDDKNINDAVNIDGDDVTLKVVKMDIDAAAIFVRP